MLRHRLELHRATCPSWWQSVAQHPAAAESTQTWREGPSKGEGGGRECCGALEPVLLIGAADFGHVAQVQGGSLIAEIAVDAGKKALAAAGREAGKIAGVLCAAANMQRATRRWPARSRRRWAPVATPST